ncbi:MAG: type II toxin-antitoxin system RelE/ParE family toxin [Planctomycetes bacterium]|nr:type II toxin-antitoxin system RelE/ParE family toxin [Planctomycetota bacterium]MCB9935601.1 type II toxin-antitoxin system RelE/ParE family toxin [Planctomycetota bacterium]
MKLVLKASARRDLVEICEWYEAQKPGLGDEFLDEYSNVAVRIEEFPTAFHEVDADVRCARLKRFPYLIFYKVEVEKLVGLAVIHQHRDPEFWRHRTS